MEGYNWRRVITGYDRRRVITGYDWRRVITGDALSYEALYYCSRTYMPVSLGIGTEKDLAKETGRRRLIACSCVHYDHLVCSHFK